MAPHSPSRGSLPSIEEMLGTLVREPSVSCTAADLDQSNRRVIDHLATWLEELGFVIEVVDVPGSRGKANLIATLGGQPDDQGVGGLVLAGHTDTVPCDDSRWSKNPFELTKRDDLFYGLGTCDMKGFFPVAIAAAARFAERDLSQPLTVVATSDEESTMAGARHLAEQRGVNAAAAVIGEPTDMQPVYGHKGIVMQSISLHGRSGHSSDPDRGRNALDAMHAVMGEVLAFREALARDHVNPHFAVTRPTLNLGCLRAGDNPNRICEHAELQIDLRLLPGMDYDEVLASLAERLETAAEQYETPLEVRSFYPPVPPYETAADGPLVKALETLSGKAAGTVAFGTEAPYFASLGIETVVFGPGSINQAHQPDEFIDPSHLQPTADILARLIEQYCVA